MKNKLWAKILVPLLIVAVIVGIFVVKRSQSPSDAAARSTAGLPAELQSADFSLTATETVDFEALASYGLPVIVNYSDKNCVRCKPLVPLLEKMNEEYFGKAFIKTLDVREYPDAYSNAPVTILPTQVFFNADGTAFQPSEELAADILFLDYTHDGVLFTVHHGALSEGQIKAILAEMGVEADA